MTRHEREEFIERMKEFGDFWKDKDVKRVYGDWNLKDALNDRMADMQHFATIMNTIIYR